MSQGNHIYFLAGSSCSGKSTLLKKTCQGSIRLPGDENGRLQAAMESMEADPKRRRPIVKEEAAAIMATNQLVSAGRALNIASLINIAEAGLHPKQLTLIEVDLSVFFKAEYSWKNTTGWKNTVARHHLSEERPGTKAIEAYWNSTFAALSGTGFSLDAFERVTFHTLHCPWDQARARKIRRDHHLTSAARSWQHVHARLYEDSESCRRNFRDHYLGWLNAAARSAPPSSSRLYSSIHDEILDQYAIIGRSGSSR